MKYIFLFIIFLIGLSLQASAGVPAVTFVPQTTCNALTNAATCSSITYSSGDLLVFVSKTQNTVGVATPIFTTSGTSLVFTQAIAPTNGFTGGAFNATVYTAIAPSNSSSTVTVTWSGATADSFTDLSIGELHTNSNWLTPVIDQTAISTNATSTTSCPTGTTSATTNANDFVLAVCENFNTSETWGALTGYTNRASASTNTQAWYDKTITSTGVQSTTVPLSGADFSLGMILTFKLSTSINWYVSKVAAGTGAGTSWTNAWSDFNNISFSAVSCGDIIWIAGGTQYSGSMTVNKTCTAGNVLTLKRVLATDLIPVGAVGWSSAFDTQVVNQNGSVDMQGAYWTIDGRVGDAATSVLYGMQWIWPTQTGTAFSNASGAQDHITVTYVEIYGPLCVSNNGDGSFNSGTCAGNTWGFNLNQGTGNTNFLLDHVWIHRWAEVIRPYQTTNLTIQYSYIGDSAFTPADHNDCMYASDPFTNFTLRYSRIYSCANQGLFFDNDGVVNAKIYDNIFYHSQGQIIGWPRCSVQSTCGPVYLLNNIFEDDGTWGEGNTSTLSANTQPLNASSLIQNNIFYHVTSNITSGLFSFDGSTTSNAIPSCSNCFNYTQGSPLTNFTGWVSICGTSCTGPEAIINSDFHLTTSGKTLFQAKGTNLTSTACVTIDPEICTDMDGNTRPTSGAWTVGPYEAPAAPLVVPGTKSKRSRYVKLGVN